MLLPLQSPPKSICILRLSAIGDCTHILPVIHSIRAHWPEINITWIIGRLEYALMSELNNVEFIVFDKSQGKQAFKNIKAHLKFRQFDVLLNMQAAFRASMISRHINAPIKLGFDKPRAKDCQWLFTNYRIVGPERVHVIDTFFQFLQALGVPRPEALSWALPISADLPGGLPKKYILIAPCSSREDKDWPKEKHVSLVKQLQYAYRMSIVIAGGPSDREKAVGQYIAEHTRASNLVGRTSLKQMQLLIQHAQCLVAPDSGPAHMATIADTPVVSLFASTNPYRTGPYRSLEHCVNYYPSALRAETGLSVEQAKWGRRVTTDGVMAAISQEEVLRAVGRVITASLS